MYYFLIKMLIQPTCALFPYTTLFRSAVRGWDRRNAYYFQLIQSLARHYGFSVDTPWQELPEASPATGSADRKSTRLNSSHVKISYAVFCLKKKSGKSSPK